MKKKNAVSTIVSFCFLIIVAVQSESDVIYGPSLKEDTNKEIMNVLEMPAFKKIAEKSSVTLSESNSLLEELETYYSTSVILDDTHQKIVNLSAMFTVAAMYKLDGMVPYALNHLSLNINPQSQGLTSPTRALKKIEENKMREKDPADKPALYLIRSCGQKSVRSIIQFLQNNEKDDIDRLKAASLLKEITPKEADAVILSLRNNHERSTFQAGLRSLHELLIDVEDIYLAYLNRGLVGRAMERLEQIRE